MDETLGFELEAGDGAPDEVRAEQARDSAHEGADHVVGGDAVEPELEGDDRRAEGEADQRPGEGLSGERGEAGAGPAEEHEDEQAEAVKPHG